MTDFSRREFLAFMPASLATGWLAAVPLAAQDSTVPRTRTLSGLVAPAFPYARPEEVGWPGEKLDRLGDEIVSWIANGELVGAELLVVKSGRAVFHEAYGWSGHTLHHDQGAASRDCVLARYAA